MNTLAITVMIQDQISMWSKWGRGLTIYISQSRLGVTMLRNRWKNMHMIHWQNILLFCLRVFRQISSVPYHKIIGLALLEFLAFYRGFLNPKYFRALQGNQCWRHFKIDLFLFYLIISLGLCIIYMQACTSYFAFHQNKELLLIDKIKIRPFPAQECSITKSKMHHHFPSKLFERPENFKRRGDTSFRGSSLEWTIFWNTKWHILFPFV